MAGFADIVRAAVAIADSVTATLQIEVQHFPWTGRDRFNKPTYGAAVLMDALFEDKQRVVRRADGSEIVTSVKLTLLRPIAPNGASGRREPIDPRDKFQFPDGTVRSAVDQVGLLDPDTTRAYLNEIYLS